jgi:hypothetical protein
METSMPPSRTGGFSAIYDAKPAGPILTEADLALVWAALVRFRESVPAEETTTQAQVAHLLATLTNEQARRHAPQHAPATRDDAPAATLLPWGF